MLVLLILSVISTCFGDETIQNSHSLIESTTESYESLVSSDDMMIMNQVVSDIEKLDVNAGIAKLVTAVIPLPAVDVKCLISSDRYCSSYMAEIKKTLIQAVKDNCIQCATSQKEEAGRVLVALMAHNPAAWKLFLTRYDGLKKFQRLSE